MSVCVCKCVCACSDAGMRLRKRRSHFYAPCAPLSLLPRACMRAHHERRGQKALHTIHTYTPTSPSHSLYLYLYLSLPFPPPLSLYHPHTPTHTNHCLHFLLLRLLSSLRRKKGGEGTVGGEAGGAGKRKAPRGWGAAQVRTEGGANT